MNYTTSTENVGNFSQALSEDEKEQLCRSIEYRYREEDFVNKISDIYDNEQNWLHLKHLEEIPELMPWLIRHYDEYYDADLSHNKILELVLDKFYMRSATPGFFLELAFINAMNAGSSPDKIRITVYCHAAKALFLYSMKKGPCSEKDGALTLAGMYSKGDLDIRDFMAGISLAGGIV